MRTSAAFSSANCTVNVSPLLATATEAYGTRTSLKNQKWNEQTASMIYEYSGFVVAVFETGTLMSGRLFDFTLSNSRAV